MESLLFSAEVGEQPLAILRLHEWDRGETVSGACVKDMITWLDGIIIVFSRSGKATISDIETT